MGPLYGLGLPQAPGPGHTCLEDEASAAPGLSERSPERVANKLLQMEGGLSPPVNIQGAGRQPTALLEDPYKISHGPRAWDHLMGAGFPCHWDQEES